MLRETIAAAFKSKGRYEMSKKELVMTLSMDLRWFSHEKAKRVVEMAIKRGLLEGDDTLRPTFDIDEVEIPVNFKPSPDVFDEIVKEIAVRLGKSLNEVISMINKKQEELGNMLSVEVVALLIAKSVGIDVSKYIEDVEFELFQT